MNKTINMVLALTVAWFGSYLYYYLWVVYEFPRPLYGYLIFLAAISAVVLALWWNGQTLITANMDHKSYLVLWLLLYAAYGAFTFFRSTQDQIAQDGLIDVGKGVILTGGFLMLIRSTNHLRFLEMVFILLVVFSSIAAILDFMNPWLSSEVAGRGAGLYSNPNSAGIFIVLFMIPAVRPLSPRWRLVLVLIAAAGVSVTFSRQAWAMWGAATVVLAWLGYFSHRHRLITMLLGLLVGAGFVVTLLFGGAAELAQRSAIEQYLTYGAAQRLGLVSGGQFEDPSAKQHFDLIGDSLREASQHPLIGNGLAYTDEWRYGVGPQNMFLLFLVEGGVIGLLLYLLLLVILWTGADPIGKLMVVTIVWFSLFSHFLLHQSPFMVLLAYIVSTAAYVGLRQRGDINPGMQLEALANNRFCNLQNR